MVLRDPAGRNGETALLFQILSLQLDSPFQGEDSLLIREGGFVKDLEDVGGVNQGDNAPSVRSLLCSLANKTVSRELLGLMMVRFAIWLFPMQDREDAWYRSTYLGR
jgi:hypothetical protein